MGLSDILRVLGGGFNALSDNQQPTAQTGQSGQQQPQTFGQKIGGILGQGASYHPSGMGMSASSANVSSPIAFRRPAAFDAMSDIPSGGNEGLMALLMRLGVMR